MAGTGRSNTLVISNSLNTFLNQKNIYILGISAYYHDSAACIVKNGKILAAAQEERFSRKKHDHRFPEGAIKFCLDYAGIKATDLDLVAFYDKPFLKIRTPS